MLRQSGPLTKQRHQPDRQEPQALDPGSPATVAVEVCIRPLVSVDGTRCTRCTPDSHLSLLYTEAPFTCAGSTVFRGSAGRAASQLTFWRASLQRRGVRAAEWEQLGHGAVPDNAGLQECSHWEHGSSSTA